MTRNPYRRPWTAPEIDFVEFSRDIAPDVMTNKELAKHIAPVLIRTESAVATKLSELNTPKKMRAAYDAPEKLPLMEVTPEVMSPVKPDPAPPTPPVAPESVVEVTPTPEVSPAKPDPEPMAQWADAYANPPERIEEDEEPTGNGTSIAELIASKVDKHRAPGPRKGPLQPVVKKDPPKPIGKKQVVTVAPVDKKEDRVTFSFLPDGSTLPKDFPANPVECSVYFATEHGAFLHIEGTAYDIYLPRYYFNKQVSDLRDVLQNGELVKGNVEQNARTKKWILVCK